MEPEIIKQQSGLNINQIKGNVDKVLVEYILKVASGIRIDIQGNTVVLNGKVHSWAERTLITHEAWATPGVLAVVDQIAIEYD